MDANNYCVIMAGGIGTRFWPMSRNSKPKQFIDFLGTGKTLIQQTYERFAQLIPKENIYVVTNSAYYDIVKEQLPELKDTCILLEPARRNTAPCIAYATCKIHNTNPNANIVVAPSDHIILKEEVFLSIIKNSLEATRDKDILMTLGITPSRPDTGYGYIQYIENTKLDDKYSFTSLLIKKVKTFTEKPNYDLAVSFIQSGDFLWNSGIFIWSSKSILNALQKYLPEVYNLFIEGYSMYGTEEETNFIKKVYAECPNISIDYGVMEKANNTFVHISDFGWSDLGTWRSLHEHLEKDEKNNTVHGKNTMLYDVSDSLVHLPKDKLAVIHGLTDYIVVENDNILLICKKSEEQRIRQFVNDVLLEKGEQFV